MNINDRKPARIVTGQESKDATPEETDWDAVYDKQQAEGDKPPRTIEKIADNGLIKFGCGCLFPILFFSGVISTMAVGMPAGNGVIDTLTTIILISVIGAAISWGPFFLFWLRDQSSLVMGGSLAALTLFCTFVGVTAGNFTGAAMSKDMKAISEMEFHEDGNPIMTKELETAGPVSAMFVDHFRAIARIENAYRNDVEKLGLETMASPKMVLAKPKLINDCRVVISARTKADGYQSNYINLLQALPQKVDALDIHADFKRDLSTQFLTKEAENVRLHARRWDIEKRLLLLQFRICDILSRRRWFAQGEAFAFTNQQDLDRFNATARQIKTLADEQTLLIEKMDKRRKAGQRMIKQNLP